MFPQEADALRIHKKQQDAEANGQERENPTGKPALRGLYADLPL
jgi:hypothetical protein